MNANEIFSYVHALEAENQRLQKSVENLLTELEEQANRAADTELIEDVNRLLELLAEDIAHQEKQLPKMPKSKRAEMEPIIEAYRKVEGSIND